MSEIIQIRSFSGTEEAEHWFVYNGQTMWQALDEFINKGNYRGGISCWPDHEGTITWMLEINDDNGVSVRCHDIGHLVLMQSGDLAFWNSSMYEYMIGVNDASE